MSEYANKPPSAIEFYIRATLGSVMGDAQGQQKPFTEKDLTKDELAAVRAAVEKAKGEGRAYIQYGDYPTKRDWAKDASNIIEEIDWLFEDPARSAMFTLGMANFDEEGTVTDTYDFGAAVGVKAKGKHIIQALSSGNPRAIFNLIGNVSGLRSGTGRKIQINTD